jgi:hypothetical protein
LFLNPFAAQFIAWCWGAHLFATGEFTWLWARAENNYNYTTNFTNESTFGDELCRQLTPNQFFLSTNKELTAELTRADCCYPGIKDDDSHNASGFAGLTFFYWLAGICLWGGINIWSIVWQASDPGEGHNDQLSPFELRVRVWLRSPSAAASAVTSITGEASLAILSGDSKGQRLGIRMTIANDQDVAKVKEQIVQSGNDELFAVKAEDMEIVVGGCPTPCCCLASLQQTKLVEEAYKVEEDTACGCCPRAEHWRGLVRAKFFSGLFGFAAWILLSIPNSIFHDNVFFTTGSRVTVDQPLQHLWEREGFPRTATWITMFVLYNQPFSHSGRSGGFRPLADTRRPLAESQ